MSAEGEHNDNRILGGYKATISNPNTSDEAKAHAAEVLAEAGEEVDKSKLPHDHSHDKHTHAHHAHEHKPRGHTKEEPQKHVNSHKETKDHTEHHQQGRKTDGEEHDHRVLGGYKATLNNPNVSEEAKEHARTILEEAGESV